MDDVTALSVRRSPRGEQTRDALLDAAERCFAASGYHAASLRDIASEARVRLGLVHYHFGNKEDLFRAVIERRLPDLVALVAASFAAAEAQAPGRDLTLGETIRAFVAPFLSVRSAPEHPLNVYVAMTSHLMSSYRIPEIKDSLGRLGEVTALFEPRLRALVPSLPGETFYAGLYLIEAALIFMVQDPGFVDDVTQGHHRAATLDRMTATMVRLFTAALKGVADEDCPALRA